VNFLNSSTPLAISLITRLGKFLNAHPDNPFKEHIQNLVSFTEFHREYVGVNPVKTGALENAINVQNGKSR
jgi:hypothetical protein